jgi:four helix bundle protein
MEQAGDFVIRARRSCSFMRKVVLNSPGAQANGKGVWPMKSVEELDVFKLAHELTLKIYNVTLQFPREESFNLVSQMRRAASSVGMNLVEGSMRLNSREFRQFVGIARGSGAEVSYQLRLARDLEYIESNVFDELDSGFQRVGQMLTRLAQSLGRR